MTRALAEVGRPGPARDVLDGGDDDPATGRLLSVGELQVVLRAARAASTRQRLAHHGTVSQEQLAGTASFRSADQAPAPAPSGAGAGSTGPGVLRPPAGRRWVAVVGAQHGAGASTVALALADAAASAGWSVHLVSCNAPVECGLVGAATVELGTDPAGGWRTGRRGAGVALARPAPGRDLVTRDSADSGFGVAWPPVPPGVDDRHLLTVVDAEAGAARAPQLLATAAAVLLVCRVSVPAVREVEQLLEELLRPPRTDASQGDPAQGDAAPLVLVAAVGDGGWSGRWPRAVRHAAGPLLAQLQSDDRVVTVPLDRHLATYRPTGSALPRAVTRSAALAVRLLASTGALNRRRSTDPDKHAGTARRTSAHPAPDPLLDDKDTD